MKSLRLGVGGGIWTGMLPMGNGIQILTTTRASYWLTSLHLLSMVVANQPSHKSRLGPSTPPSLLDPEALFGMCLPYFFSCMATFSTHFN